MTHLTDSKRLPWLAVIGAAALLLLAYLPVVQTIPNGAEHYFMIDVGETQIVLNRWGTLHATGYPHYVITGGALVAALRLLGVSPTTAPALVSLLWGGVALGLIYALGRHLTGRALLPALLIVVYGLTRTVWIHHVIAEIYTLTLALLALLLTIALWRGEIRGRIYWLALIGGVGVAHHRALAMAAPALIYAVWPQLTAQPRRLPRIVLVSLLLGLLGFLPYVYLPLRALAGAAWVYGEPGTWAGFWDQFWGREASRFIGSPGTLDGILANFRLVTDVLILDLTLPGLIAGVAGLMIAAAAPRTRRVAVTLILSGMAAYLFHGLFYTDVLSALILATTLSLAFGWLLLADALLHAVRGRQWLAGAAIAAAAAALGLWLYVENRPFIAQLTSDPRGLETIEQAREAPDGSTLMLAWGPRHFAVGYARDVLGELGNIRLVDHKADYRALLAEGPLVTPAYTFYNQPIDWWEAQLGGPVYLRAVAPGMVQIDTQPEIAADAAGDRLLRDFSLECRSDALILRVEWRAAQTPEVDQSVFVHLLDADGAIVAQADQSAPVSGWRPLTSWAPNEIVRDYYALPRDPNAARVRFGLYETLPDGGFRNTLELEVPVECDDA